VLPGIGHFTILDHRNVTPEDAGNNFFLEGYSSVGKSRAEEAVRLLAELNDGVNSEADTSNLEDILRTNASYLTSFTIVIAHNLDVSLLDKLSSFLWSDPAFPPLVVVRSAGFLAEFFIQFHEHASKPYHHMHVTITLIEPFLVIESHSETVPSLRIDKAFPALLEYSLSLDFANMDPTDHTHVPYVIILVRALEDWKKSVSIFRSSRT
jgi:NEDD8-activating enzyme E1 regulatory subunit